MGVMPVTKLLFSMALPMMISMMVQALYNIVDSIYVSRISEHALTAVSLAFPVQNMLISISSGICVGMNALLSRSLGEKDQESANKAALNGIFLSAIGIVLFLLFGLFGASAFFRSQTDIQEIVEYGTSYVVIVSSISFGIFGEMMFERILQSTGRTVYTLFTQGTGAIVNIILDPILIFGYFGLPAMGVTGAAIATVTGQIVAFALAVFFNIRKNTDIRLHFAGFRPEWRIISTILRVGVPTMIMIAIGSAMNFGMNQILLGFTSTAAAVYGVQSKLQSFAFMPVFGLNNGLVPIVAYNYGAKKPDRIVKAIRTACIFATCIMVTVCAVFQFFPDPLLKLFDASDDMLKIGRVALRTMSLSFLLAGCNIILSSSFQAMGNGLYSMAISVLRQVVVLLPSAYLLSRSGILDRVWMAYPLSELASTTLAFVLMFVIYKKRIKPLYESETE